MLAAAQDSLLQRRQRSMGPTYSLSYEEPLHPVRAEGVWLYDADGRRYLDAYNNVPVVGHCHPAVVEALVAQARTLNTNTRYLTDKPVELAERLLATMPEEIDNIVFTCTGSEANDLAVRICREVTGARGLIITARAYHGTSAVTAGLSPAGRQPLGDQVYAVPAPVGPDNAARFGAEVAACIERMTADGVRCAALIVDTVFSTDGLAVDPAGFLAGAVDAVRAAGGLFIADEVQAGHGRTGSHMWGFARHDIVPDIVTMGKPMGNGHPIGAMAARGALTRRFSKASRYFNTFGGNTVSCAVALAVLDVIEREKLMANAVTTGDALRSGLKQLAERHETLGEVRGAGLFCGVEVRENARTGLDATREAARVVNALRRAGVLVSTTGAQAEVLKIRPPLPFAAEHADQLVSSLDEVLSA
jgi:4-aminobutyrate aminotransferase-like enzyme